MNHDQALSGKASERYLLGEMSETERFEFEEHYFQCAECAQDVRAGTALVRGIRAVSAEDDATLPVREDRAKSRWWDWFTPAALVPTAAAAALACVVGYQSWVTIPSLSGSRALAPVVLRAAARGDEQTVEAKSGEPYSVFSLDVNAAEPGTGLVYEFAPDKGQPAFTGSATAPPPGSPLLIVAPHRELKRAGAWTLVLRKPDGAELARYPFQLKLQ